MSARVQNKEEGDLFEQFQTADKEIRKKTKILLPDIKRSLIISYENVIFLAIGFVMACVICFTLGVEKGKRYTVVKSEMPAPNHSLRSGTGQVKEKTVRMENLTARQNAATEKEIPREGYIIQLAAFKQKSSAEQSQSALRKTGYPADIRQSGDYYQLYVGGFKSIKDAEGALGRLKSVYKDCYIKKL